MNNISFFDRIIEKAIEILQQSDGKEAISFVYVFDIRPYGVLNVNQYTTVAAATDILIAVNKRLKHIQVATLSVDQIDLPNEEPNRIDTFVIDDLGDTSETMYQKAITIYFEF